MFTEPRYAYVGGSPSYGVDPTGTTEAQAQAFFIQVVVCPFTGALAGIGSALGGGGAATNAANGLAAMLVCGFTPYLHPVVAGSGGPIFLILAQTLGQAMDGHINN